MHQRDLSVENIIDEIQFDLYHPESIFSRSFEKAYSAVIVLEEAIRLINYEPLQSLEKVISILPTP